MCLCDELVTCLGCHPAFGLLGSPVRDPCEPCDLDCRRKCVLDGRMDICWYYTEILQTGYDSNVNFFQATTVPPSFYSKNAADRWTLLQFKPSAVEPWALCVPKTSKCVSSCSSHWSPLPPIWPVNLSPHFAPPTPHCPQVETSRLRCRRGMTL